MKFSDSVRQIFFVALITTGLGGYSATARAACAELSEAAVEPLVDLIQQTRRIVLARAAVVDDAGGAPEIDVVPRLDRERELTTVTEASQASADRFLTKARIVTLTVTENLKGGGDEQIYLVSTGHEDKNEKNDFAAHEDEAFWSDLSIGRASYDSNCKLAANFNGGATYLVFVGSLHIKAFELITDENDRWLEFVRERISD